MMIETLLMIAIALLLVLIGLVIYLIFRSRSVGPREIESAIANSWVHLKLDQTIGAIQSHAADIRRNYVELERMLRAPTARGALGELSLESMLSDQLPPSMYGIRQRALDGRIPDAWIDSTVGLICIDSKFPLDNYRAMIDAPDEGERLRCQRRFLRNVRDHLKKVAQDYVRPELGSAEFAFAYIPSEAVYYFLANEGFELLRSFTAQGVQVVSPLTLAHKIALIKAGVGAKKLSEEAQRVWDALTALGVRFDDVHESWRIFYGTHLRNLQSKAQEIDAAFRRLSDAFRRLSDEYL